MWTVSLVLTTWKIISVVSCDALNVPLFTQIIGVVFAAAYMVAKGTDIVQTAMFVKRAFIELLKKVVRLTDSESAYNVWPIHYPNHKSRSMQSFGSTPTKEQLEYAGTQCPICHDTYTSPVLLECSHIFCELCVGHWFDREQTCPLCRAKVADDPSWRDGATTQFNQLF